MHVEQQTHLELSIRFNGSKGKRKQLQSESGITDVTNLKKKSR